MFITLKAHFKVSENELFTVVKDMVVYHNYEGSLLEDQFILVLKSMVQPTGLLFTAASHG